MENFPIIIFRQVFDNITKGVIELLPALPNKRYVIKKLIISCCESIFTSASRLQIGDSLGWFIDITGDNQKQLFCYLSDLYGADSSEIQIQSDIASTENVTVWGWAEVRG